MPRVLSLFLVLLLLLRGLAGDAMAMGMSPASTAHMPAQLAPASHDCHGAPDAARAAGAPNLAHSAQGDHHADHAGSCTPCGICHSALSLPHGLLSPLPPHGGAPRPHGSARFASALPVQAIKPPIS